jgi:hypothetical protein
MEKFINDMKLYNVGDSMKMLLVRPGLEVAKKTLRLLNEFYEDHGVCIY